jgi:hypothetical protein
MPKLAHASPVFSVLLCFLCTEPLSSLKEEKPFNTENAEGYREKREKKCPYVC